MTATSELDATLRPIIQRFERFYLGRTANETDIARIGDLIVVRSKGMLTDAESRLLHGDPTPGGRDMVEQMYRKMVRQAQESFTGAVESALSVTVRSFFCDIDATSGESIIAIVCE